MRQPLTLLRYTRKFAVPLWPWYAAGIVFLALTNYVTLKIPLLAKSIVNGLDGGMDRTSMQTTALAIVGLGLLTMVIRALSRIFIFWPGRKLEATTKSYLFARMMRLPQAFYQQYGMGELISRLANDVGMLRALFAFGMLQFLNLVFLLGFTISQMLTLHPQLTIASLSPIFLMLFMMRFLMNYMHRISLENQQAVGRLTNRVTEAFVNVHVIKSNAAEQSFIGRTETENQAVFATNMRAVVLRTVLFPLMNSFMNLSQVIVLFYGGYEIIHGRLSVGDILAFNVYIAYLGFPLSAVGIILSLFQRTRAALERIAEIDAVEPEDGKVTLPTRQTPDLLTVEHLSFSYPESEKPTLCDISFSIAPGEHVGIFGTVGSGKTTLFDLIARLSPPPQQSIFLRDQDTLSMPASELRQRVGYVQQTVHLFSESIEENLRFGLEEAPPMEALANAANGAQVGTEIRSFPAGWQTEVGEKGLRLSGGQKQRLALARIFVRTPELLLLDDVLSAVDNQTEKALIEYISSRDCAVLVASHKISALQHCDKILILDEGRLIDQGSYAELRSRHPIFAQAEGNGDE